MCTGKAHWYYTVAWVVAMGILADVAEGSRIVSRERVPEEKAAQEFVARYRRRVSYRHRYGASQLEGCRWYRKCSRKRVS
jgi:hypothetical protein